MIPPLLFLLQFFLRQEPLHDLGVDDAVQMIQLMAEAPGDQFLALKAGGTGYEHLQARRPIGTSEGTASGL